jgi:hypothetical protein
MDQPIHPFPLLFDSFCLTTPELDEMSLFPSLATVQGRKTEEFGRRERG